VCGDGGVVVASSHSRGSGFDDSGAGVCGGGIDGQRNAHEASVAAHSAQRQTNRLNLRTPNIGIAITPELRSLVRESILFQID
jgi:hypothetical protein